MDKIESVDVDQTVMGRILDYGDVTIRGTGTTLEPIREVDRSAMTVRRDDRPPLAYTLDGVGLPEIFRRSARLGDAATCGCGVQE
jgi:hypothetical protein